MEVSAADVKSYVHYDYNNGKLSKVTSRPEQVAGTEMLEVSYIEIKDLMSGRRRLSDYSVVYDAALKHMRLKEESFEDSFVTVDHKLYKVTTESDPDFKITWNTHTNYWNFALSDELKHNRHLHKRPEDVMLYFSITNRDDPNVLHKTISINLKKLLLDDYQTYFKPTISTISIYTVKYFEKYSLERI